jgi:hypothetical protein
MNSKERFTTSAKVVTITFMVGGVALLVARGPFHYGEASVPTTPVAVEQADGRAVTFGSALSPQQYEAAARAAPQDDPPIPTF